MFGISFLMGGMLFALAGVSIPVIIHLLHRQRTQPIQWGAMQFLLESPLHQKRRQNIEHWLLLLLRMLIIALFVFMLARLLKQLNPAYKSFVTDTSTDVAVVIDHSLSTGRRAGDKTVFEKSIDALETLAEPGKLRAGDTVSIVLAEHADRRFTPLPISPDHLPDEIKRLRSLRPGMSDSSIAQAVQSARELITRRGRNANKVIIVVSDAQRTGWDIESLPKWNAALGQRIKGVEAPVKMYELSIVPDATAGNVSVGTLSFWPNLVSTNRTAQITTTVVNHSSKQVDPMTARLTVGGKQVGVQAVPAIPAGESRTLEFRHTFTDTGSNAVQVSVDARDALEADNASVASVYVWQTLPVLIIDGKPMNGSPGGAADGGGSDAAGQLAAFSTFHNSRLLQMAMLSDADSPESPSVIRPTIVGSLDSHVAAHLNDYACVVLNDVPRLLPDVQGKLQDYVKSGHGLWIILGDRSEPVFVSASLAQAGLFQIDDQTAKPRQNPEDKSSALDIRDAKDPVLARLVGSQNVMSNVKTFKWWSLKPRDRNSRTIVAAADTNDPLIIDRPLGSNYGHITLWTTSLDGGTWNNWTAENIFAPLVNETIYHLSAAAKQAQDGQIGSGTPIVWVGPAEPAVQKVTITRPDGSKVERRPRIRDGRQVLTYGDTDLPGKYELRFDQTAIEPVYYGVGISPAELDEATLTDSDRAWLTDPSHKYMEARVEVDQLASLMGAPNTGKEIWPWLAGLVLCSLLFETFMTWRMVRQQTGPSPDSLRAGILPTVRA